jgi:peptidylamidoglycolate lyase
VRSVHHSLTLAVLGVSACLLGTADAADRHSKPRYEVVRDWPALPGNHPLGQCVGVGVDSHDNVFVFHRSGREWTTPFPKDPVLVPTVTVFEGRTGRILASWGANQFIMPHGLTLDHDDNVWLTDVGLHQIFKFTHDGRRILTLGEAGKPGADKAHFNQPTDVAVLTNGAFYVSDGYKNTRVVKFTAGGQYEFEWGGKGAATGQFNLPHGVAVDFRGRIYVCDRSNSRLQVFDPGGKFLAEWKGPQIGRPYGVSVGVNGHIFAIDGGDQPVNIPDRSKVVELDAEGRVLDSFGSFGSEPGQFQLGHDIAVARDGSVYVADAKGQRIQKFQPRHTVP